MSPKWSSLNRLERQRTERVFEGLEARELLRTSAREEAKAAVGFSSLHAYVNDPSVSMTEPLEAALDADERLQKALSRLLEKAALFHSPRMAAASQGQLEKRQGLNFAMDFKESRADSNQVYVIVKAQDRKVAPGSLFVTTRDGKIHKHPLADGTGPSFQLLFDAESEILKALRDPESEVNLV